MQPALPPPNDEGAAPQNHPSLPSNEGTHSCCRFLSKNLCASFRLPDTFSMDMFLAIEPLIDHSSENCDEHIGCLLVTAKIVRQQQKTQVETKNLLLRFNRPNNGEKHGS
ncbi:hypothetical protein SADUNF_Sadunf16G0190200 [Salix dunnii]|uniref:Uncharacterized protein n=1 Tax=Salix dunnii TaxID=1413687 RepID=A0A835MGX7_9ROSI|nr:hypothetical protein SADUNF_Sadunf16G0190200 [Salix dunnii]